MSLHFDITADNKNFLQKLKQAEQAIQGTKDRAEEAGLSIDKMWQVAGSAIGIGLSVEGMRQFAQAVIKTRAEIEAMEVSMRLLTGSASVSSAMMAEFKQIAASTPLDLPSLAKGAEIMLSFGIETSKVLPIIKQIGDISGGDAGKLQSLALAFSQASSAGRLMGQDLLQMINAGFNPLRQISQDTGISIGELKKQMEAGAISVDMLEIAFKNATAEGGMFHGMLEAQGKGLKGAINGLSGAWADMLNEIGESQQGVIKGGYDLATSMVQNYKTIGEALITLSAAYGVHKAALIAHVAIPSALKRLEEATAIKAEQAALSELIPLEVQESLAKQGLIKGTAEYSSALKLETIAVRDNARAKVETLATEEVLARKAYQESLRRQLAARERMQQATQEVANALRAQKAQELTATASQRAALQKQVDVAITNAQTAKNELNTASVARNTASKHLAATASARRSAMSTVEASTIALDTAATQANTAAKSLSAKVTSLLSASMARLNAVLAANKFTLLAVGITAVGYGLYKWVTAATALERVHEDFNNTLAETAKQTKDNRDKSEELLRVIRDGNETSYARKKAYDSLIAIYPQLLSKIDLEKLKTMELAEAIKTLNDARDQQEIKNKQDSVHSAQKALDVWDTAHSGEAVTSADLQERSLLAEKLRLATADLNKTQQAQTEAKLTNQDKLNRALGRENDIKQRIAELSERQSRAVEARNGAKGFAYDLSSGIIDDPEHLQREIDALKKKQSEYAKEAESYRSTITTETKRTAEVVKQERDNLKAEWDKLSELEKTSAKGKDLARQIADRDEELKRHDLPKEKSKDKKHDNDAKKRADEARRARHENERLALELEEAITTATKQGADQRIALIKLEHKKRMLAIRQYREEMIANAQDGKLSDEQNELLRLREALEKKRYEGDNQKHSQDGEDARLQMLKEYGTYLEKRQALKEIAEREMANAETEWHKKAIQARLERELSALDLEEASRMGTMARIYQDMTNKSSRYLQELAREAKAMLDYITKGEHVENNPFGISEDALKALRKSPGELKAVADKVGDIQQKASASLNPIKQIAEGIRDLFNAGGDEGKITAAIDKIRQGLEKTSATIKFISGHLNSLGEATGSGALKGIASGLGEVTGAMDAMSQGVQAGAAFGPIGQAAGAALGLVSSLAGTISKLHDKKHEKRIQELAKQVESLGKSYDKLAKEVDKAYSTDASNLIAQQETLLKQKQIALRQMANEEERKKKGDKAKAESYRREADEIDKQIADNKEKARDAIFGKDIKSAIEEFASAYAEAWAAGSDRAEASKDFVRKQIRSMIMETIKETASKPMEDLRKKLLDAYSDGVITTAEEQAIERMAVGIQEAIDDKVKRGKKWLESDNVNISASRGGVETMSQDTGKALEGRFTAMHEAQLRLLDTGRGALSVLEETRSLMVSGLGHLERIAINTKHLSAIEERLEGIERNTKSLK